MHRVAWSSLLVLSGVVAAGACGGSPPPALGDTQGPEAGADVQAESGPGDASLDQMPGDAGKPHDAAPDVVESGPPFMMAAHPPWPQVPGNALVVLHSMKLVTVVTSGDANAADLFAFGDALIASSWWSQIAQEYGLGTPSQNVHVTGAAMTANPTEAQMLSYIEAAVAGTPAAAADGDTMYMLYLPPGIDIVDPRGPNTNCQYYGGYHSLYDKSGDAWGVAQHCPVTGTQLTDLQSVTIIGSHEIVEGASDPIPNNGWTLPALDTSAPWTQTPWIEAVYGEIGDLCAGTQITEGLYIYQRIWSNAAAALEGDPCVPTYTQYAYDSMSAPQGWYPVTSGGTVTIPVTGFSNEATTEWLAFASIWKSSGPTFQVTLTSPTNETIQGKSYPTLNNGTSGTVTVTAPAAASGSWAIVALESDPYVTGGDPYHTWVVGVYIP